MLSQVVKALIYILVINTVSARPSEHGPSKFSPTKTRTGFSYAYSSFSYTQLTSNRYATPLPSPLSFLTPFAPDFSKVSSLLPDNVTYTTYSFNSAATTTASPDGQFGQSAYAALWENATFSLPPPFTTTVNPTPVATSELVFPPALYNAPHVDKSLKFPPDFIWGVAGSAFQIEGGLQVEGRGPSTIDFLTQGNPALNDSNVADMNYYLYKQDIARLAAIGVPYYSFSIAWTRVVPFGIANSPVNLQALAHYDDVINTCLAYGITPIVTLTHLDTPLMVDFVEESSVEHFLYYAKQVMTRYGNRVPYWVTFNEPNLAVTYPAISYNGLTHTLLAHAAVYDWYKNELGGTGNITMKFANNLAVPLDPNDSTHIAAALRYQDFLLGIMANPLFLGKQYPDEVLNTKNYNITPLTDTQLAAINGKIDFWAFDPYVAQFASPAPNIEDCVSNSSDPLWPTCTILSNVQANGWLMGQQSNAYAYIAPQYVRQQIGYVWNTFRPSGILISEFGFNPFDESLKSADAQRFDLERTLYYQDFLDEVLKSIHEDLVNVIGALAWSFIDNNEFGSFANQYGMQLVNRTDGTYRRQYKRSFFDFVDLFHNNILSG